MGYKNENQLKGDNNMNTISTSQNKIDLYTQKNDKISKALETAKAEELKKEIQDDSIEISNQAVQSFDRTGITNRTNPLDDLVTAGTITQDQATAIQSAFQSIGKAIQSSGIYNSRPVNPLDSLVTDGTITKDQETAIKSAFESSIKPSKPHSKHPGAAALDSLVNAGTITKVQEDAIMKALKEAVNPNKLNLDEENKTIANPLDSLVSLGTINDSQKDVIMKALEEAMKPNKSNNVATNTLVNLVSKGTITKAQEDAIKNAFEAAM